MKKRIIGGAFALAVTAAAHGQAVSVNGGAISGTITDKSGAALANASISIRGTDTGFEKTMTSDRAGFYSVGPLNPGNYDITVTQSGFQTLSVATVVRTGTVTNGNFKLTIGQTTETVQVNAGQVQVNTDQAGVSDVITKQQIESLPINGRNFLDVAQIEPGVILQSGQTFDPTKAGYSAISVSGISGRTTRILLDGQDITDETVGTTIFNVSQGSIGEFQLNRSTQDVSGDVTSTGQVLVASNAGTNKYHGEGFYNFQDARSLFATVGGLNNPFQRNQFGGSLGGPIIHDKLFFFGNIERIKQDQNAPILIGPTFPSLQGLAVPTPYRETYSILRLDYNGPLGGHYFVRANYNVNSIAGTFNDGFQLYDNRDNTPGLAGGADFTTGRFTHSFRGSYEKFHNLISDATAGNAGLLNLLPGITFENVANNLFTGPNDLAPQGTFQSDKQARYDGTWTKGSHIIRYGYSINRILGGGFADFFGLAPRVRETAGTKLAGASGTNPVTDYHASSIVLGNGLGFFTERPGFGLIGSGVEDWREGAYGADSWKVTPNFTLSAGVRWSVDTDRANQDLAGPNCSDIDPAVFAASQLPCTGSASLFGQYGAQFAGKPKQPYADFAPQIGFAYAPGNQKTVFRAGFGIYFDGDVFNNTTNARSGLLKAGPFFNDASVCASGFVQLPSGQLVTSATVNGQSQTIKQICAESVGAAAPFAIALQNVYQTASKASPTVANSGYIGETLNVNGVYGTPYRSPYSEQWNFGIQREVFKGAVLTADYVHNSTLKISQTLDVNHVGAARFYNTTAAQTAVNRTLTQCGVATVNAAIAACPGIHATGGANIQDFANNGLDSGANFNGGSPNSIQGLTAANGAAFAGQNPLLGQGNFILPVGRSGYDALQVVFRQVANHPAPGIKSSNIQVSYSLSRIVSTGGGAGTSDTGFTQASYDNDNPTATIGRAGLDHKHEVSFGGSATLKYGPKIGIIGHFFSALPTSLTLDTGNEFTNGNIFQSDISGDGTAGDLLPGTTFGDYGHRVKPNTIGRFINSFNSTSANTLTPAGKAVANSGVLTQNQLIALGGAIQPIANPSGPVSLGNPTTRLLDVNFSYPIPLSRFHLREGITLEPAIAFYNVGNFSNFGDALPSGQLLNQADAGATNQNAGYITGPNTFAAQNTFRTLRGTGTFNQGAPRTTEYQLRLNF